MITPGSADGALPGVRVWDGERDLGTCDLRWSAAESPGGARDAVFEVVAPRESAEGPRESARGAQAPAPASPEYAVIPGLIDTHVHLGGYAGHAAHRPDFMTWPLVTRPEERVLHQLANARTALAAGVTTLRDLSADDVQFSLRRALDAGIVTGPRLAAHGMVSMTAGHGDLFTPAAFAVRPPTADGVDACRALVRHFARAGADGIKIATSGGVLSIGDEAAWRNHTRAEVAAIVDEAHALGMRVAAHAHTADGIAVALAEGADSLEHGTLITAEQADAAVAAGVSLAPTLLINDRIAAGGGGVSPAQAAKARELIAVRDERLAAAAAAGVDVVLGTDANGTHVGFGDQMAECRAMARVCGWSASRTLAAATSRAAAVLGRGRDLGRIAPGYRADFVVMDAAPWLDLSALATSRIVAVVSRGVVVAGALPTG